MSQSKISKSKKSKNVKEDLMKKINEKEQLINNYVNDLKRLQADFENYIKRSEKEKEMLKEIANQELS